MKTSAKLWKTESLKSRQKSFLIVSILTISILPFIPQDLTASELQSDQPIQVLEKQNSLINEMEYHAKNFVDAEIFLEMHNWENAIQENSNESFFAEISQLENLLCIAPYKACEYAEDEMLIEINNHAATVEFIEEAELITLEGCNKEIDRFAQKIVWIMEQKDERQSYANDFSK